jgi:hypothetical protein
MPNTYKSPAQLKPSANTLSTLYTVPTDTQTVTSNIHVCNIGTQSSTIRLAVQPDGNAISDQNYLFFGLTVAANDTVQLGDGITMDAGDIMSVWSSSGSVNFILSYAEVTE